MDFLRLQSHVDDSNQGKLLIINAFTHRREIIFSVQRVIPRLQRRRCAGEEDRAFLYRGANDGDIPCLIARDDILLVGILVLFVDDDKTKILHRGKDRAPGPDDNACLLFEDLSPFVVPLPFRKIAVKDGHLILNIREALLEPVSRLGSE